MSIWERRLKSIFPCDKKKLPRSGGPKPEPSSSGSGLEARSSKMSARCVLEWIR